MDIIITYHLHKLNNLNNQVDISINLTSVKLNIPQDSRRYHTYISTYPYHRSQNLNDP